MIENKLYKINNLISKFKNDSELNQGYIHVEFQNGIHDKSFGTISVRHNMSGGSDYNDDFRNLDDLIISLKKIKSMQDHNAF